MNNLPSLAKNYRIFIDTSSLMEPSAESFLLGTLIKQLEKNKNKIIVPFKVLKELQGLVKSNDPIKKFNARKGYSIFLKLEKLNCAIKMGEKGDGLMIAWHENGKKECEATFKDGKKDGLRTEWHKNGKKKRKSTFKDGKEDGLFTSWSPDGKESSELIFKDGQRLGGGMDFMV